MNEMMAALGSSRCTSCYYVLVAFVYITDGGDGDVSLFSMCRASYCLTYYKPVLNYGLMVDNHFPIVVLQWIFHFYPPQPLAFVARVREYNASSACFEPTKVLDPSRSRVVVASGDTCSLTNY